MKSENESSTVALSMKVKLDKMKANCHKIHRQQINKSDMIYYNFQEKGLISQNCNRPKPKWKRPIASATDNIGRMALVTDTYMYVLNRPTAEDWYADSSSTDHITSHFEYFTYYEEFVTPLQVQIGNNTYLLAKYRGTVKTYHVLNTVSGLIINITNVLYVI